MRATILACAASIAAFTAPSAAAQAQVQPQIRVQGQRPIDPRLRNQPSIAKAIAPDANDQDAPANAATGPDAPAAAPTIKNQVRKDQGGPLKRPSYLGGADPSTSSGPSALDLMKQCFDGSISGAVSNPACVGYMAGFVGAVRISATVGDGYPICLPDTGLTNESIVSDVSAYLEATPDALQKSARSVVFLVLSKQYPCPSK